MRMFLVVALATVVGLFFLTSLLFVGSVVDTLKIIRSCFQAWPLMLALLIILTAFFGFWSGLGLYLLGFWIVAFVSSDTLGMIKIVLGRSRVAV